MASNAGLPFAIVLLTLELLLLALNHLLDTFSSFTNEDKNGDGVRSSVVGYME